MFHWFIIIVVLVLAYFLNTNSFSVEHFENSSSDKEDESEEAVEVFEGEEDAKEVEEKEHMVDLDEFEHDLRKDYVGKSSSSGCRRVPKASAMSKKGNRSEGGRAKKAKRVRNCQKIVLNVERNPEYEEGDNVKLNRKYDILVKDKVENNVRRQAEEDYGIKHIRPDIKDPFIENSYTYVHPAMFSMPQRRPPICIPQKGYESAVHPMPTSGTPLDALPWQEQMPRFTYNEVYDPKYYYPNYYSL